MPILPRHDGQDARRHQILILFAITFESPYMSYWKDSKAVRLDANRQVTDFAVNDNGMRIVAVARPFEIFSPPSESEL
jgi:hypothetical protein